MIPNDESLTTDYQLLGDLLGVPPENVRETLAKYSLRDLGSMTETELRDAGLTPAKARKILSAFELARRYGTSERMRPGQFFENPRQIFDHFHLALRHEKREMFIVVLLDARHRVMKEQVVSIGSLTTSIVHPREVFRPAIRDAAGAIVLVHNHPSGDPRPSDEDVAVTRRLVHGAELLGIRVLDHIIVGDGTYASFKETGLL